MTRIDFEKMRPAQRQKIVDERKRKLAAERATEKRIVRVIGYTGAVIAAFLLWLAAYDISNSDFPAVSVSVFGGVIALIIVRKIQLWKIRHDILSGKQ